MPAYEFHCGSCGQSFVRRVDVDRRDEAQVCEFCGNGAQRRFAPATILVPWTFGACTRTEWRQTYDQARATDKRNEEYYATKKEPLTYEQCVKDEFDKRGIRRPNRIFEP